MANNNPNTAGLVPFKPGHQLRTGQPHRSPLSQAAHIQRILFDDISDTKTKSITRAALARAWCAVEDAKRVLLGKPLPGQLRPDLDPLQLMKALKRSRSRKPIELQSAASAFTGPLDDDEPAKGEKVAKVTKPETKSDDQAKAAEGMGEQKKST